MIDKIKVEDFTKPPTDEDIIDYLVGMLILDIGGLGKLASTDPTVVVIASLAAAQYWFEYVKLMDEEILNKSDEIVNKSNKIALEKIERMKNTPGVVEAIKSEYAKLKKEFVEAKNTLESEKVDDN